MGQDITWVGIDAHKDSLSVAMSIPEEDGIRQWRTRADKLAIARLSKKLRKLAPGQVVCCYEAGPCGYELQRQLGSEERIHCMVVAPSLVPRKPGQRVKTDRRDARHLVGQLRAGELTEVHPPSREDEAARDLCRYRDQVRRDRMRCRHRLLKMLLRRGVVYRAGKHWTHRFHLWLAAVRFEEEAAQAVLDHMLVELTQLEERMKSLDARIEELASSDRYCEVVGWVRCFRGFDTIAAMIVVAELYAFFRFRSPRHLMSYLGIVASEHSSGESHCRGGITKTGNSYLRRILVQAAWNYRHLPKVTPELAKRREGQPAWAIEIAEKAQHRLHRRYRHLALFRRKGKNKVTVALARELTGFLWAVLHRGLVEKAQAPQSRAA